MDQQVINVQIPQLTLANQHKDLTIDEMDQFVTLVERQMKQYQMNQDFKNADYLKTKLFKMRTLREAASTDQILSQHLERRIQIDEQYLHEESILQAQLIELSQMIKDKNQNTIDEMNSTFQRELNEFEQRFASNDRRNSINPDYQQLQKITEQLSRQGEYKKAEIYQSICKDIDQQHQIKQVIDLKERQTFCFDRIKQKQLNRSRMMDKQRQSSVPIFNKESRIKTNLIRQIKIEQQKRSNQITAIDQKLAVQLRHNRIYSERLQLEQQKHTHELQECRFFGNKN